MPTLQEPASEHAIFLKVVDSDDRFLNDGLKVLHENTITAGANIACGGHDQTDLIQKKQIRRLQGRESFLPVSLAW
jgi:hypothetical protein